MTISRYNIKNQPVLEYSQLADEAKPAARQAVLDDEVRGLLRDVYNAKEIAKNNIHAAVNNPYHVLSLVCRKQFIRSLVDVKKLEGVIEGNLCHFLPDGTYIRYLPLPQVA